MHASPVVLVAVWLPWAVLGLLASIALGRGTIGSLDSTRYGLMTMGIHIRGVLSLCSSRIGKFHVTPKEGIDPGGLRVLRMLPAVTTFGVVLAVAWLVRLGALAGLVAVPAMPRFAAVVTIALGAWELGCIAAVLVALVRRRQLRTSYRFGVELKARIAGTSAIVSVTDLSLDGAAFVSPVELPTGMELTLLTRVSDAAGQLADLELPVEVRSARYDDAASGYRIGSRMRRLDEAARALLVEYCFVVMPAGDRLAIPPVAAEAAAS
jgi:hypothetical protein